VSGSLVRTPTPRRLRMAHTARIRTGLLILVLCGWGAGKADSQVPERSSVLGAWMLDWTGNGVSSASLSVPGQGKAFSAGAEGRIAGLRLRFDGIVRATISLAGSAIPHPTSQGAFIVRLGADTIAAGCPVSRPPRRTATATLAQDHGIEYTVVGGAGGLRGFSIRFAWDSTDGSSL
jgi:hypothetical protein